MRGNIKLVIFGLLCILFYSSINLCSAAPAAEATTFDINEATIQALHDAIQNKKTTCEKVIQTYLERIKTYNLSVNDKPPINAFTEINPNALLAAQKLDAQFVTSGLQGPLHCVPIILKDNIDTYDMSTTGGSFALLGNQPNRDAFLVEKLRKAGAIFIGKGGMDEFGWGLIGISSRIGRIGNAYDPNQNPGGSSGGVAAAVAANFAMVGIGTDNSGSIRIPAAFNGVIGLRPSQGLVSQRGIIPMGNMDAVAGPIARNVADLVRVLQVIATTEDPKDPKTKGMPRTPKYHYEKQEQVQGNALSSKPLRGKRLGIVRQIEKIDPFKNFPIEAQQLLDASLKRLQAQGVEIVDPVVFPKYIIDRLHNQSGEREDVNEYLSSFPATRENFQDICRSDRTRTFGTSEECLVFVESLPARHGPQYHYVLQVIRDNKNYVESIMQEQKLDALIVPVSRDGSASYDIFKMNSWVAPLASNAGLPSLVLNAGFRKSNGMPVGMEVIAKQFDEAILISIGSVYEQVSPKAPGPNLIPSQHDFSHYSIAQINNLFTLLGVKSYETVLKNKKSSDLTAENFKKLFLEMVNSP